MTWAISIRHSPPLEKIRPYIRKFHSSEYINDLANGDLCLSLGYSGDVIMARNRAREAKNGVAIAFEIPKEGAQMSVDMLGIPADAPHPQNALRFIDYLLRPQVIADISDAVSYPNPNLPGTLLVKPAIRDDPAVYPPAIGPPPLFCRSAGAGGIRAGAHPRLDPAQIGRLMRGMPLLEVAARQQAFRRPSQRSTTSR